MRRTLVFVQLLILAAAVPACTLARVGPRDLDALDVAVGPAGSQVELTLSRSKVRGELLEVTREHVMVKAPTEILVVPFEALRTFAPHKLPLKQTAGRVPSDSTIAEWLPLARFPAGIRPEHLTALLADHGQSEPRVVR